MTPGDIRLCTPVDCGSESKPTMTSTMMACSSGPKWIAPGASGGGGALASSLALFSRLRWRCRVSSLTGILADESIESADADEVVR